jgi:hypothetical protein
MPESPPSEEPFHVMYIPSSKEEAQRASLASQEEIDATKEKAGIWRKVQAWQFGELATFLGDLSVAGWFFSGGRLSIWKMMKLSCVLFLCFVVVVVMAHTTTGMVVLLIVGIAIGGVVVGAFVWSWVQWIRGKD